MPHVDEGQLHAYLDRGPGDATASEWATFESHLALCEDCQGRLEEARRLRERAQEILAGVGPVDIVVPPFEALVERSAPGGESGGGSSGGASRPIGPDSVLKRRWRSGNFPLAWAATIMVAVGAGWMARQVTMSSSEFEFLAERPATEVMTESAETPAVPGETQTAMAEQESLDRLEAKVDDGLVGRRANNEALPSEVAADLEDAANQRAAAKTVVVTEAEMAEVAAGDQVRRQVEAGAEDPRARAEAERRDGAVEEDARELSPSVARDAAVAQTGEDNQRKAGEDEAGVVNAAPVGALAQRALPDDTTPAAGHAALGCYALEVDWGQAEAPPLPARVRLLAQAVTPDPNGGEYFRSVAAGRAYELSADPSSGSQPGYWVPLGADSVLVRVPGESAIVELRLGVTRGELNGVASAVSPGFADADQAAAEGNAPMGAPPAVAPGSVSGRSIDCSGTD